MMQPYLDRELSPKEVEEVRGHLEDCGGCESTFVVEELFLERIRTSVTSDVAPKAVRERLIVRIRHDLGGGSGSP